MGRKSRSKQSTKPLNIPAYSNKKEVDRLVQKLIHVCMVPTSRKDEWDTYLQVDFLVQRIRQCQTTPTTSHKERVDNVGKFKEWMQENGVCLEKLQLEDYGVELGIGLKAVTDIKRADTLIEIPYRMMMTAEKSKKTYLADFIESKRLLQEMPNISLALFLHCEKFNPDSFYKPYIDALPGEYNTALYFTPKEMELLKGTQAFFHAITQCKSIARQYGIFYNMMHGDKMTADVKKIPESARNHFTFDAYRWAVSSVSTRLNKVAIKAKEDPCSCCHHDEMSNSTFALIPLWDMMNHSTGELSTNCDPETETCVCYSMKDFQAGEQVTIFYGARDNTAFLIYNGFVAENNRYDKVEIQLGVSTNDKLYAKKVQLLEKLKIKPSGSFQIYVIAENLPITPELQAFLRVFHMNEEDLDAWNGREYFGRDSLREIFLPVNSNLETEKKIWKFLENRVNLLLMGFKSDEELEKMLSDADSSPRASRKRSCLPAAISASTLTAGRKSTYCRSSSKWSVKPRLRVRLRTSKAGKLCRCCPNPKLCRLCPSYLSPIMEDTSTPEIVVAERIKHLLPPMQLPPMQLNLEVYDILLSGTYEISTIS